MPTDPTHRQSGFTLLEMTIVLTIAALVFGVGAISLTALKGRVSPWTSSLEIAQVTESARLLARRTRTVQSVVIDLKSKTVFVKGGRQKVTIPNEYSVSVTAGREIVVDTSAPEIKFLPDGTSSGGEIVISSPAGPRARVDVSWLTGLASVADASS